MRTIIDKFGRERVLADDEPLPDGARQRIALNLRDSLPPLQRAIAQDAEVRQRVQNILHQNQPGWTRGLRDAAERKRVKRDPQGREVETEELEGEDGLTPLQRAYADYDAAAATAWRGPAMDAKPPPGAYPLSAGEGSTCTKDGFDGVLVREGDWLICRVSPTGADAAPRGGILTDAALRAAKARVEQAYAGRAAEDEQAWRRRG